MPDNTEREEKMNVLKLHLELDLEYVSEDMKCILKKYGSMKNAISRDILVPEDITLHALNYAILRMFGWQNGHLHHFSLPKDVHEKLTENRFITWSKMVGVYFRFPTEDFDDIYWDDDYTESQSIKTWMKKKYTGPYKYKGFSEHYVNGQKKVKDMLGRWDEITVHEFDFEAEKQPEPYNVKLTEASLDQVMWAFADVICYELVERMPLVEVLRVPGEDKVDFVKVREKIYHELSKIDIDNVIEDYRWERFSSMKKERTYLEQYDIPGRPVTEQLCYKYDYGDGWEVLISCDDVYTAEEKDLWVNASGEKTDTLAEALNEVIAKHRPVCIEKDGIELVDDVGGIDGFCNMLQTIYECDYNDEEQVEERESMLDWADMMGWTGRKISPKQTL